MYLGLLAWAAPNGAPRHRRFEADDGRAGEQVLEAVQATSSSSACRNRTQGPGTENACHGRVRTLPGACCSTPTRVAGGKIETLGDWATPTPSRASYARFSQHMQRSSRQPPGNEGHRGQFQ